MANTVCLAHDDPARIYEYCPSLAPSILFAIFFLIATVAHILQAVKYRQTFSWVLIMAGIWEIAGYAARSYSITQQANSGVYTAQFLLILLAPLWINAFVYMVLGRMAHFYLVKDRIFGLRARRITLIFVLFDITAFVVQLSGGLMASGDSQPIDTIKTGLKIYTFGVAIQLCFIAFFCAIAFRFRQLLMRQDANLYTGFGLVSSDSSDSETTIQRDVEGRTVPDDKSINYASRTSSHAAPLLMAIGGALLLIIFRNIFRLVEYGMGGVNGNVITRNEWFQYVFDAVPMFLAIVILNLQHPGKTLQGEKSDFKQENMTIKAEKKEAKSLKKAAKQATKDAKLGENQV